MLVVYPEYLANVERLAGVGLGRIGVLIDDPSARPH